MTNVLDRLTISAEIVLGALLHAPDEHLQAVRSNCPTPALWPPALDKAYTAILELADKGKPITAETVGDRSGMSVEQLLKWQAVGRQVSRAEVDANVEIVIQRGKQWHRMLVGRKLADGKIDGAQAQRELKAIDDFAFTAQDTSASALGDAFLDEISKPVNTGVALGLGQLDQWTWGWQPGKSTIVSAPYKGRKTTLLRNIVLAAASRGKVVSVAMCEGQVEDFTASCVAMIARQLMDTQHGPGLAPHLSGPYLRHTRKWKTRAAERDVVMQAVGLWKALPITLYDARHGAKDPATMKALWRRFEQLDLVAVDYAQILAPRKADTIFERMVKVAGWMGDVITELQVHMVMLSQLNEEAVKRGSGYSPGTKGGGDLPAQADQTFRVLYNKDETPRTLKVEGKLTRDAQGGMERFVIDPQSGLIKGVVDAPMSIFPPAFIAPQQDSLLEVA